MSFEFKVSGFEFVQFVKYIGNRDRVFFESKEILE